MSTMFSQEDVESLRGKTVRTRDGAEITIPHTAAIEFIQRWSQTADCVISWAKITVGSTDLYASMSPQLGAFGRDVVEVVAP